MFSDEYKLIVHGLISVYYSIQDKVGARSSSTCTKCSSLDAPQPPISFLRSQFNSDI